MQPLLRVAPEAASRLPLHIAGQNKSPVHYEICQYIYNIRELMVIRKCEVNGDMELQFRISKHVPCSHANFNSTDAQVKQNEIFLREINKITSLKLY